MAMGVAEALEETIKACQDMAVIMVENRRRIESLEGNLKHVMIENSERVRFLEERVKELEKQLDRLVPSQELLDKLNNEIK